MNRLLANPDISIDIFGYSLSCNSVESLFPIRDLFCLVTDYRKFVDVEFSISYVKLFWEFVVLILDSLLF